MGGQGSFRLISPQLSNFRVKEAAIFMLFQEDPRIESHWTNLSHMPILEPITVTRGRDYSDWSKLWRASTLKLDSEVNHSHVIWSHRGLWGVLQSKTQVLLPKEGEIDSRRAKILSAHLTVSWRVPHPTFCYGYSAYLPSQLKASSHQNSHLFQRPWLDPGECLSNDRCSISMAIIE